MLVFLPRLFAPSVFRVGVWCGILTICLVATLKVFHIFAFMIAVFDHVATTSLAALQMDHNSVGISSIHPIYDGGAVVSVDRLDIVNGIEVGGGCMIRQPPKGYPPIAEHHPLGYDTGARNASMVFLAPKNESPNSTLLFHQLSFPSSNISAACSAVFPPVSIHHLKLWLSPMW